MNEAKKRKRAELHAMKYKEEYYRYRDSLILSEEEAQLLDMVFLRKLSYNHIADILGYEEQSIKRKMSKLLAKLP